MPAWPTSLHMRQFPYPLEQSRYAPRESLPTARRLATGASSRTYHKYGIYASLGSPQSFRAGRRAVGFNNSLDRTQESR